MLIFFFFFFVARRPVICILHPVQQCNPARLAQTKPNLIPTMTTQTANPLALILDAIVDSVAVAGSSGAPGGVLYSALMGAGCTLNQFHQLMALLLSQGRVTQRGQLYFAR